MLEYHCFDQRVALIIYTRIPTLPTHTKFDNASTQIVDNLRIPNSAEKYTSLRKLLSHLSCLQNVSQIMNIYKQINKIERRAKDIKKRE